MRKLIVFLMMALLLINTGCSLTDMKIMAAQKMEKNKIIEVEEKEDGQKEKVSKLNSEITSYLEKRAAFKSIGGTAFEVHELYGTEEKGGNTLAYIWSRMQEYNLDDGKLTEGSGYSMPLVVELKEKEDGSFEALKYEAPRDGEHYAESVKKLFPAEYREKVLTRTNAKELDEIVRQKAKNHFNLTDKQGEQENSTIPGSNTSEQNNAGKVEKDGVPKTDSGTYVGQIDNNSIEIMISGVPLEKAARAFRLSESVKAGFDKLSLKEGEQVLFNYFTNGYDQMVITEIKRLKNK